jgi:hypothetical protein
VPHLTPLHYAVLTNNTPVSLLLLSRGADPTLPCPSFGRTLTTMIAANIRLEEDRRSLLEAIARTPAPAPAPSPAPVAPGPAASPAPLPAPVRVTSPVRGPSPSPGVPTTAQPTSTLTSKDTAAPLATPVPVPRCPYCSQEAAPDHACNGTRAVSRLREIDSQRQLLLAQLKVCPPPNTNPNRTQTQTPNLTLTLTP